MNISNLPVEILSEIFETSMDRRFFGATNHRRYTHLPAFIGNNAPMNLLHVCRHWRMVAFSMPSLWNSLSVEQFKPSQAGVQGLEYWLRCSGKAPLHFRVRSQQDSTRFNPTLAITLFPTLAMHMERWQSLSIGLCHQLAKHFITLLQNARNNLPPLETLEIKRFETIPQSTIDSLTSVIRSLKTLRCLYINCRGMTIPQSLPWSQLDKAWIWASFSTKESISCLEQCVAARTIVMIHSVEGTSEWAGTSSNPPHITLANLTSLSSLFLDKGSNPLCSLRYLTLPSLSSLTIEAHDHDFIGFTPLIDFLKRSRCPLKHLAMIDATISNDDIIDFFSFTILNSISHVELAVKKGKEGMLDMIRSLKDAKILPPHLMVWRNWPYYNSIGWRQGIPTRLILPPKLET